MKRLMILALMGLLLAGCNDVFFDAVYSILLAIIGVALVVGGYVLIWQWETKHESGDER
jgi:hypothetical protein